MTSIFNSHAEKTCVHKKKIVWISLLVFDFFNIVSQTEILKHLAKRGYDTCLFAMRSKKRIEPSDPNLRVILVPIRDVPIISPLLCIFALSIYLPFYIAVKRPDFIITTPNTSIVGIVLKLFLRSLNFKVILDIRSTPIMIKGTFRESLVDFSFRLSVLLAKKNFDGITILTELMKRDICSKFNVDPNFVGVCTSGVDAELFKSESYDGKEMKKKFGLQGNFVVFYHGGLGIGRGIVETIKGMDKLQGKYPNVVLFLLGQGSAPRACENFILESGMEDKVIIHRWVNYEDVPKFVAMCDLGIVPLPDSPNWRYQCPLKLLEYLAMKKAVIVTDIPANREVVRKSKCGIYIPSADSEEIAKAIAYAYNNQERLGEWGSCGRAIIEEKYSWKKVVEDLERFLDSLSS